MNKIKEKDIKMYYNTDENDIINEFYYKVLSCCKIYKRAVAYFSSSSLLSITEGIEKLVKNYGNMKLLVSPQLSEDDIEAINNGYLNKEEIIYDYCIRNFNINEDEKDRYNYLAWLIYESRLDIKVVVKKDYRTMGIFHEKLGIVEDYNNDKIAFNGSMNETKSAFKYNYESINVFKSWNENEKLRVDKIESNFDDIWNNKSDNWISMEFPKAIKGEILKCKTSIKPIGNLKISNREDSQSEPKIPDFLELRNYQKDAIKSWFDSKFKGVFEMATGTGKTITAISSMVKVLEICRDNDLSCGIVIVVPYKSLLEQWVESLKLFNIKPIMCYENQNSWIGNLKNKINLFNMGINKNLFVITTNTTFNKQRFQELLLSIKKEYILCIDEMHHAATEKYIENLPGNCSLRLGLSATLQSDHNKVNTYRLIDYFGSVVYEFGMDRAIQEGFLTPYYYYPIFVELTEQEKYEYNKLTGKIGKLININIDDECLTSLLMQRSRILASAENKIKKLIELKPIVEGSKYNIFYCGDKIENDDKYIYKVNRAVSNDLGLKTHTFTSDENKSDRIRILNNFKDGTLEAVSAIRCLDEGIDIPELRRAFILSSSTNPKEFIQRRGRILRLCKGKTFAEIYDFIVVPSLDKEYIDSLTDEELRLESKVLFREIKRFDEFADLAINSIEAHGKLMDILDMYDI